MRKLYNEVELILSEVNFNEIWPDFSRYQFALYDRESVYLKNETITYDERFLGNTAIEYNNEYIAIWNVVDPQKEDAELLAADLVHEMFHAYQRSHGETRFPNDLVMLDYPDDLDNYQMKHTENQFLVNAYSTPDLVEKRNLFHQFMSARKFRQDMLGDMIYQEYFTETIEGLAEYAGCMALKQISVEKYENRIKVYLENLRVSDHRFFDIRRSSYFSGALLCVLMKELDIDFYHEIGKDNTSLFELISKDVTPVKPSIDNSSFSLPVKEYTKEKKEKFDHFLLSHSQITEGDFIICGYDPMNMIKMDDMILCDHFILLQTPDETIPQFVEGPVLLKLKRESTNQVYSYIK